jgi:hypothetical protein
VPVAAILCPGPSLTATFPSAGMAGGFAFSVAVNAAIHHQPGTFRPDWWLAMDDIWFDGAGQPAIAMDRRPVRGFAGAVSRLAGEPLAAGRELVALHDELDARPIGMRTWSVCAALYFALRQGASVARLYGCDQHGTADCTGLPNASDRSEDRWRRERADMAEVVAYVRAAGMDVQRMFNDVSAPWG